MQTDPITNENVLTDIIETLEDGRKGFEAGAEKLAEDGRADLAAAFRDLATQRAQFASELRDIGRIPHDAETGSIAGTLHRGWMALKDALAGSDPDGVLDAAEQGEDHAVAEYERALDDPTGDLPSEVRHVLVRQYEHIRAAHDRVKALRDAA